MDPHNYEEKYKKSRSRGSSLGTMDFMEQQMAYGTLGHVAGTTTTSGNGSGMTITTSNSFPQATAYTLTSALGMK